MLNKDLHRLNMVYLLKSIYSEIKLSGYLGFKGGTAAYFLYDLPRFSVDLDFDLLGGNKEGIFKSLSDLTTKYGEVKDFATKRNTILFELSYGEEDHNIKIEISLREVGFDLRSRYELKDFLGITTLAAKKGYLLASKLYALTNRSQTASRDIFDIHHFLRNKWDLDKEALCYWVGEDLGEYFDSCIGLIEQYPDRKFLFGLGEVVEADKKGWIRKKLKEETLFYLRSYKQFVL